MNLHNMTQKSFFEGYLAPPPVISRCYATKASAGGFAPQPVGAMFSVNKYLSSVGKLNANNGGLCQHLQPLARRGSDSVWDPIVKIVGGFVGSKSQAGNCTNRGREVSLWDVIMDKVVDVIEQPGGRQSQGAAKKVSEERKVGAQLDDLAMFGPDLMRRCQSCLHGRWVHATVESSGLWVAGAETPPRDSGPPERTAVTARETAAVPTTLFTDSDGDTSDLLSSSCDSGPRQPPQRTISECSADSDDSFIVFESGADDDPALPSEDDSDEEGSSSDDDLDEIDNCVLYPHTADYLLHFPTLTRLQEANDKWKHYYSEPQNGPDQQSSTKKVHFAQGANLCKIKHLVVWDFAHRAARVGPWEMYYRDTERFKSRIAALSTVLSPVLAAAHRKTVYLERFPN